MKIICIGRNYRDHAKELNNPVPKEPVVFCKPDSAILQSGKPFFIPEFTSDVHHEVELVVRINKVGKHIDKEFAHKYYDEIGIGIDFTARDIQKECKEKGLPWEKAKGFDGSAPLGKFVRKETLDLNDIQFRLEKNGEVVQQGTSKDMMFSIDSIISHVSKYFTLKIGDLIYTGTPKGVGKVEIGDTLEAYLGDEKMLTTRVK
ncbi:MAG: fumarylacetoacetate hydrolase family protein [Salibacter sp.]|uniref:fumarylacetoacetate hydrolase family protein n=1 Tax=Salibacter sp. TaxID=2010995 RepID=UPI002870639A|nr:fumarylacetoacetate hydrolase family protein [Salibacter sp.]MDR9399445.1 fumarylacetoacetate hydrolase family protein [Salibacter sp.]